MNKYSVLWIDDNPSEGFLNEAFEYGLEIEVKTCHNDGIAALRDPNNSYDAIILDANCKITNDDNEKPSLDSLTESILEVHTYCMSSKFIPWFIYTGGGYEGYANLESRISAKRDWDDRKYYNKPIDRYNLFENLKKVVEETNSKEWLIRNSYQLVFEVFETKSPYNALDSSDRATLLKLLVNIEFARETSNPDHLNNIRKFVAGGIMKTLSNMGVIPADITELNKKGRHLGDQRYKELIPVHVQRSFYSILSVCQDGSHSNKEAEEGKIPAQIDKLVREGNAPYLLQSLVFELLNILNWLKGFMVKNNDKEKNKVYFGISETINSNRIAQKKELNISSGIIEKDELGNYHCDFILLTYKHFGENTYRIGDEICITEVCNNSNVRTCHLYPKSAMHSEKV
jgi:hypothetical protein